MTDQNKTKKQHDDLNDPNWLREQKTKIWCSYIKETTKQQKYYNRSRRN